MLSKTIILTKHAMERFEERKLELTTREQRKYNDNPRAYVLALFNPMKIKRIQTKEEGKKWVVVTQGNYRFVVVSEPGKEKAFVKTMTKYNSSKSKREKI